MHLDQILVKSKIRDYKVNFVENADFIYKLKEIPNSVFIIDDEVWNHHKDSCLSSLKNTDNIVIPISENRKNLETVQELYAQIMEKAPKKNMNIISIGGGILQDISGFLASTLYRGINWIFIPTTSLAQVDSCIGAKTSLNFNSYKNLIGTFYPPSEVYIYPGFLLTQKPVDYYSGIGEMAKLHIMSGKDNTGLFVSALSEIKAIDVNKLVEMVKRSLLIKKSYIEEDEFDTGIRNLLNYGHCFGHAIESVTDFCIPHGQAVVIGILLANLVSRMRGVLSVDREEFFARNILLPIIKVNRENISFDPDLMVKAMKKDKKNTGSKLAIVIINDNYDLTRLNDLTEEEVNNALSELRKYF